MPSDELQRKAFYVVPEKQGSKVVQVVEVSPRHLVVQEPETRTRWTISRSTFEERLAEDRIVRVTPRWDPAGEVVTAIAA